MKRLNSVGDTIIEVVLAMSILSVVLTTSWGVTNRATLIMLSSRQRVDAVNRLVEQAEIVKAQWMLDPANFETSFLQANGVLPVAGNVDIVANPCDVISLTAANPSPSDGGRPFFVQAEGSEIKPTTGVRDAQSGAPMRYWAQYKLITPAQPSEGSYIEVYIRGCWETNAGSQKTDSSQLVLRLNV